jgi:transaldolase
MKFFIDTADLLEIEEAANWGVLAGVTTNPTLYSRIGGKITDFPEHIQRICALVDGPVSAEAVARERSEIIHEGRQLASLAPNVVVKIPVGVEGLAATRVLADEGIAVNMTLIFSVTQAIMSAWAGARYISPFIGRFDDTGQDGLEQLAAIISAIGGYDWRGKGIGEEEPEIIAASIRTVFHVTQAALLGADIATVPFDVLKKCLEHPLTASGLVAFENDWAKVTQA